MIWLVFLAGIVVGWVLLILFLIGLADLFALRQGR